MGIVASFTKGQVQACPFPEQNSTKNNTPSQQRDTKLTAGNKNNNNQNTNNKITTNNTTTTTETTTTTTTTRRQQLETIELTSVYVVERFARENLGIVASFTKGQDNNSKQSNL